MSIRILIADDQRLFRQSLRYLFDREEDMIVVGDVSDGQDAYTIAQELHPDIILMDADMPKLDGITATRMILERVPSIKILMLSVHDEDERIITAIRNGAIGYILKDADHREFIRIIRDTYQGRDVVSPFLANRIPKILSQIGEDHSGEKEGGETSHLSLLTEREKEILRLLSDGMSNKEISDALFVSIETIKSHLQTIYRKLNVKCRTEAAILYLRESQH